MGGKAGRLGDLLAMGFPVPRGFILTPAALVEAVTSSGIVPILQRAETALLSGDSARARLAGWPCGPRAALG